ncbi:unnamed protein product [Pylaiella littoralis]
MELESRVQRRKLRGCADMETEDVRDAAEAGAVAVEDMLPVPARRMFAEGDEEYGDDEDDVVAINNSDRKREINAGEPHEEDEECEEDGDWEHVERFEVLAALPRDDDNGQGQLGTASSRTQALLDAHADKLLADPEAIVQRLVDAVDRLFIEHYRELILGI